MAGDDAADVGQADAGPLILARGVQALEDAEQLAGVAHVETDPVVADEESNLSVRGGTPHLNLGTFPATGVLQGIGEQIAHHQA